jgi:uncharacterized Ntn-hydrolase superfamily protein
LVGDPELFKRGALPAFALGVALLSSGQAHATYSISACDETGACGVAVATHNLAVGANVAYADAKVGALATQFETNPNYGPRGLSLLAGGRGPEEVLAALLAGDGDFEGQAIAFRQVAIVDASGRSTTYTGAEVNMAVWAGGRRGRGYAIIGNGLAHEAVVQAMERAFLSTTGALPERLLAALEAGQAAGGQSIGAMSAAVLVRTPEGPFQDVDLRVDASPDPIGDLRRLLDLRRAHEAMLRAERVVRAGRVGEARAAIDDALRLGRSWDRIRRRAARLYASLGDPAGALDQLAAFAELNPRWARSEVLDPLYDSIRDSARFRALRSRLNER